MKNYYYQAAPKELKSLDIKNYGHFQSYIWLWDATHQQGPPDDYSLSLLSNILLTKINDQSERDYEASLLDYLDVNARIEPSVTFFSRFIPLEPEPIVFRFHYRVYAALGKVEGVTRADTVDSSAIAPSSAAQQSLNESLDRDWELNPIFVNKTQQILMLIISSLLVLLWFIPSWLTQLLPKRLVKTAANHSVEVDTKIDTITPNLASTIATKNQKFDDSILIPKPPSITNNLTNQGQTNLNAIKPTLSSNHPSKTPIQQPAMMVDRFYLPQSQGNTAKSKGDAAKNSPVVVVDRYYIPEEQAKNILPRLTNPAVTPSSVTPAASKAKVAETKPKTKVIVPPPPPIPLSMPESDHRVSFARVGNIPSFPAQNAIAPAPNSSSAAATYILTGIMDFGDNSAIILQSGDLTYKVRINEEISPDGWRFVGLDQQKAMLQKGDQIKTLATGESFTASANMLQTFRE